MDNPLARVGIGVDGSGVGKDCIVPGPLAITVLTCAVITTGVEASIPVGAESLEVHAERNAAITIVKVVSFFMEASFYLGRFLETIVPIIINNITGALKDTDNS
jgi:hypothetical protein